VTGHRTRAAIAAVAVVAAGVFAAQARAHHADLTQARYCGNIDTVFVTASAWEGIGQVGSRRWKRSRTNADVGIYLDTAPMHPNTNGLPRRSGAFNEANGFSFKAQITGVTDPQVVVAARAVFQSRWGDGNGRGDATEVTLEPQNCSGPRDRFVRVNGKRLKCTVVGNRRANTLSGTPRRDVICGFGGRDRLWAGRGNDVVVGAGGADLLLGVAGRDFLLGGAKSDELNGGRGRDRLSGGRGADTLLARDGLRDKVSGGGQHDRAQVDCDRDRRISIEGTFAPPCG
jgi:hypothetical protein